MIKQIKQILCKHEFAEKSVNVGYYDEERWKECTKCGYTEDISIPPCDHCSTEPRDIYDSLDGCEACNPFYSNRFDTVSTK